MKSRWLWIFGILFFAVSAGAQYGGLPPEFMNVTERQKVELQKSLHTYLTDQLNQTFEKKEIRVGLKVRWKVHNKKNSGVMLDSLGLVAPTHSGKAASLVDEIAAIDVSLFFPNWVNDDTMKYFQERVYTFIPIVDQHKVTVWTFRLPEPPKSMSDYVENPNFLRMLMMGGMFFLLMLVIVLLFLDNPAPTRVVVQVPQNQPKPQSRALVPVQSGNVVRMAPDEAEDDESDL